MQVYCGTAGNGGGRPPPPVKNSSGGPKLPHFKNQKRFPPRNQNPLFKNKTSLQKPNPSKGKKKTSPSPFPLSRKVAKRIRKKRFATTTGTTARRKQIFFGPSPFVVSCVSSVKCHSSGLYPFVKFIFSSSLWKSFSLPSPNVIRRG